MDLKEASVVARAHPAPQPPLQCVWASPEPPTSGPRRAYSTVMIILITRGFCDAGSACFFCHSLVHLRRRANVETAPAHCGRTTPTFRVFRRDSSTHITILFSFLAPRARCDTSSDLGSQCASSTQKRKKKRALPLRAVVCVVLRPIVYP